MYYLCDSHLCVLCIYLYDIHCFVRLRPQGRRLSRAMRPPRASGRSDDNASSNIANYRDTNSKKKRYEQ